jgi:hypothetical protein
MLTEDRLPIHQVGASNIGVDRALRAALQAVTDLSCYEFKHAGGRPDGDAPSQGGCGLACISFDS